MLQPFANEPILELRRSAVRVAAVGRPGGGRRERCRSTSRCRIGPDARAGSRASVDRPGGAGPGGGACRVRSRPTRSRRRSPRPRAGLREWRAVTRRGAGGGARRAPPPGCASGGSSWPRSRCASAPSRGSRPTPTCARRSTSSSTTRAPAIELGRGRQLLQVPGERNELRYAPRGVVAVISPWNFPLAIPCGMTSAALVTGNAVVLKPAEQSPAMRRCDSSRRCAPAASRRRRCRCSRAKGDVGAALVRHPDVATIAFTGSLPVGLEIVRAAAETGPASATSSASSPSSAARTA